MNVTVTDLVERIRTGPAGPRIGAFFDLDGTLVRGFTATAAFQDRIRRGQAGPWDLARLLPAAADGGLETLGRAGFAQPRGTTVAEVTALAARLFTGKVAGTVGRTGGWTAEELNAQVAEPHDRFAAVLEDWPA